MHVLKWTGDEDQYLRTTIRMSTKSRDSPIYIIVAILFVDNPCPDDCHVMVHMDGDKNNCHFSNLRWCNASMNQKRSQSH